MTHQPSHVYVVRRVWFPNLALNLSSFHSIFFFFFFAPRSQKLVSLLPKKRAIVSPSEDAEEVDMIELEGTKGAEGDHKGGEAYDDSDDEEGQRGHSHMGCTQQ